MSPVCRFPGCGRETRKSSLCVGHEKQRQRRGADGLTPLGQQPWKACSVEFCEREHYAKGMCGMHYNRARMGLPLEDPWTERDEAFYQSALHEVAGIFERRVNAEMEAGESRAEAEREFRDTFPLLASILASDSMTGSAL